MGVETRRPPLPAPTDTTSVDDTSPTATEVATNVTTRTDKTSYTIPEDGSPIVISTHKKDRLGSHSRQKSQTSLLIEYFEGSKSVDGKTKGRPSVRVKVTPSSRKSSATHRANDAVQITSIGSDRKPSYTRRISLNNSKAVETGVNDSTELSHSSGSNLSNRPPVEIEVLNDGSDLSNARSSRGLLLAHNESNVSSMPPDSMLEGESARAGAHDIMDEDTVTKHSYLAAPQRQRSRSTSRERLTQKVMEKLGQNPAKHRKTVSYDETHESRERRRHKSHRDSEAVDGSALSSNPVSSQRSYNSDVSQASRLTNNARLLEKVEDTIKRILLPEITAIRDDQRADRKLRDRDDKHRYDSSLDRRVSKSSSSPNIRSKPRVVLNREGDDPGTTLSRGDSEYKRTRRTSGEKLRKTSAPRKSDGYDDEEATTTIRHRRSSKSGDLGKLAAAGLAGGALTAAALKHHDSEQDMHEKRKRRSKSRSSRSRSNSIVDGVEEAYTRKEVIPPMPMASHINDSDLTRTSLLSTDNDLTESTRTPIREVSRGSLNTGFSPVSSRTAVRTPVGKDADVTRKRSSESPRSVKNRTAELAAVAGLAGAAAGAGLAHHSKHANTEDHGATTPKRGVHSPAQSVSSLRMQYEDPLVPAALRPQSAASRSSIERLHQRGAVKSATSSPIARAALSRELTDEFVTPMERPDRHFARESSATPSGEDVQDWFDQQHLANEQLRNSLDTAPNRASYQTNPYPEDEKRFVHSDGSSGELRDGKDVRGVGANPNYVHTPLGVESAVASLIEPSALSSAARPSSIDTPPKFSYSDRMAEQLKARSKDDVPLYEGSSISQTMPSTERWAAIKKHAHSLSASTATSNQTGSPRQSPVRSVQADSPVKLGTSGVPLVSDPIPEIGHFDDTASELSTNPSIIQGPLGGDPTGQSTWPYSPSPPQAEPTSKDATPGHSKDALIGAGIAGGALGAAAVAANAHRHAAVEGAEHEERGLPKQYVHDPVDRHATPTQDSPLMHRDEGYVTDPTARTPQPERKYTRQEMAEYKRAMDQQSLGAEDPFTAHGKNARSISGDSHGIGSPLYDSATGKGIDNIQSKDIVALMDHLTVRDAQRNARDTEILITLVRTATEMRQNFEDMKKFIHQQDKIIMANTDRGHEATVQKVMGGPRPLPGSPRTPRTRSEEDIQQKRKGVLRRALKGLTGGRSSGDLTKIEDMLMQVLDNVEQLKHKGPEPHDNKSVYMNDDGMDSYEKLRAAPDSGYEPDGFAGTNSTPSQSGQFAAPPSQRGEKQVFHSGYNGRPGSETRVSTVLEGDEDEDLEPHERNVLAHQFENNERLLTPTRDFRPDVATSPTGLGSPTMNHHRGLSVTEMTPKTGERQSKHKSNVSSIFGVPKMSRWSKTTTSSAVPESPATATNVRPISAASRSGSDLQQYDDDLYEVKDDDRLRSTQSLARENNRSETRSMRSQGSRLTRTPSPLIPSEASYRSSARDEYEQHAGASPIQDDDYDTEREFDDPKYKAIRNSIALQHPQPRQASTGRHQSNLESQAHSYNDKSTTNSDISQRTASDFDPNNWGSAGAGALNKTRFSQAEPISPVSMSTPYSSKSKDNTPLVPSARATQQQSYPEDEYDDESTESEEEWQPQYSNSGFARNADTWYSSPLGSGHLLEPIAEVRYSLETDSGRLSPEAQIASARAVTARKITGPRPMGSRSTSAAHPKEIESSGTVRRKPVPGTKASRDTLDSQSSETF